MALVLGHMGNNPIDCWQRIAAGSTLPEKARHEGPLLPNNLL
jgi:hypothetical protein